MTASPARDERVDPLLDRDKPRPAPLTRCRTGLRLPISIDIH